jgi:hypothetical protein
MTIRFEKKRRDALRLGIALGWFSFGSLPSLAKAEMRGNAAIISIAKKLTCIFSAKESAKIIGRKYLQDTPEEADIEVLVHLLCRHPTQHLHKFRTADSSRIKRIIREQHLKDFEFGRTLRVNGWILSETETRLCALSAMMTTL